MHTDTPRTHFSHFVSPLGGSVAVSFCPLQCSHHFPVEMFHVDDSYCADRGIFFMGEMEEFSNSSWGRVVEKWGGAALWHASLPPSPSSLLSVKEVLHGLSDFLVFNLCCVWTRCLDNSHRPDLPPPLIPSDFVLIGVQAVGGIFNLLIVICITSILTLKCFLLCFFPEPAQD